MILALIKAFWNVFAEEGFVKQIHSIQFHIDTGDTKPICCILPNYRPHESCIIIQLVMTLFKNGLFETDDCPYGFPSVLAAKPHQEHVHWSDYVW
jgi:hypothetical protein